MQPPQLAPGSPSMPRAQVMRRGTSRAVPVVVSAGLAVGVFCGLMFGVGTGKEQPAVAPSTGTNARPSSTEPEVIVPTTATIDPNMVGLATKGGGTVDAGTGSAAVAAAGTDASDAPASPPTTAKLMVEITPEAVAATAKITVDGKPVSGFAYDIDLEGAPKKDVEVVIKAAGYKPIEQKVTVDHDTTLKLELIKQRARPAIRRGGGGTSKKPPSKPPNSGHIDI